MKSELLLSLLFVGGSAGMCLAQEVAPPGAAAPPATAAASADAAAAGAAPTPQIPPAAAAEAAVDPTAPLVTYSGSMTTIMTAMSPAKAAFALVGAAAMLAEGKQIIADNNVVDPSRSIAHEVAADFARMKSARVAEAPLSFERKGMTLPKPAMLASAAPDAAYVVDVDSGWILAYFPVDWAKYKVIFNSNMRLVDTKSQTVVAKHFCNWDGEKRGDQKFTRDELLGESAKGLKEALARGAEYCAGEFKTKVAATLGPDAAEAPKAAGS
jgi:hypothetical protein